MNVFHSKKEVERHYLNPVTGVQERRRKLLELLAWGILVGAIASLLLAIVIYFITRSN